MHIGTLAVPTRRGLRKLPGAAIGSPIDRPRPSVPIIRNLPGTSAISSDRCAPIDASVQFLKATQKRWVVDET